MIFEYRCSGVGLPGAWVSLTMGGGRAGRAREVSGVAGGL